MLAVFVRPVAGLMHRLSFQKKFILAGGLMVVALLVALAPGVARMQRDAEDVAQRLRGVDRLVDALGLLEDAAA